MLEPDLVIEISGGRNEPGTALQVGVKRPSGSAEEVRRARSQLWLLVPLRSERGRGPSSLRAPDGICRTDRQGRSAPDRGGLRFSSSGNGS